MGRELGSAILTSKMRSAILDGGGSNFGLSLMFILSSYKSIQNKEFLEALKIELGLNQPKKAELELGLNTPNQGELKITRKGKYGGTYVAPQVFVAENPAVKVIF